MKRREFILGISSLLCLSPFVYRGLKKRTRKPNILLILTDQQRQDSIGAYEHEPVITPHLDRMAREGIRFNRAYVAQPLCAPNRGSIFSGLYPFNHGVRENTWLLSNERRILPDMLAEAGYHTAYFGKWHLGDASRGAFHTMPFYKNDGRGINHYFNRDGNLVYQTEALADDAIAFMTKEKESPFFAVVSIYPPHRPHIAPQGYKELYKNIFPESRKRRKYYGMCTAVDDAVGRILGSLESLGLEDDTLVIFTSDHGFLFEKRWNGHEKRLCYDEAAKIPLIMKYPKGILSNQVSEMNINSVDLTPTILGLAGIPAHTDFDGTDMSIEIIGNSKKTPNYTVLINIPFPYKQTEAPPHPLQLEKGEERCIVHDNWKLIISTIRPPELYELESDPMERQNLWDEKKDFQIVSLLKEYLREWAEKTKDKLTPQLLQSL